MRVHLRSEQPGAGALWTSTEVPAKSAEVRERD